MESMKGMKLRLISVNSFIFFLRGETRIRSLISLPEIVRLMMEIC
jgi:hypothetical protein